MGKLPRISCNKRCDGCPALPLTKKQYDGVIAQLFTSSTEEDKELAQAVLNMEALFVFCLQHQEICVFRVPK